MTITVMVPKEDLTFKPIEMEFVQARNYTRLIPHPRLRRELNNIVLHSTETAEVQGGAIKLARYFSSKDAPKASFHYVVDCDNIVQCVIDRDIAWHAPGCNRTGIGIEMVGRAGQTVSQWRDDYSLGVIRNAAALTAALCKALSIPVSYVSETDLIVGAHGITTHSQVSAAFHKSNHTDPGRNFPITEFVNLVRLMTIKLENGPWKG